ncbi:MAG: PQQ-binding-like beta-propeller repeat protein, partial [Deltaproteobacteria bacterium]|nr:PQQ-binding-like beta-propeller repeat protein [Deltaproteobacteria bacterium]
SSGDLVWSYTTGHWMHSYVYSSPAVAEGRVYVGSDNDTVFCLDASDGGLVWCYETGGNVGSSPAVADGKVYVG